MVATSATDAEPEPRANVYIPAPAPAPAPAPVARYLRACRPTVAQPKEALATPELLQIALAVAKACEFLEARKVVHRALMCRNVLVGADHRTIKLAGLDSIRALLREEEYIQSARPSHMHPRRGLGWVGI